MEFSGGAEKFTGDLTLIEDPQSKPVIEALAMGIPVVASRAGPLPEMVARAGIIVEPRDAARLAAALRAIWVEGAVRSQLVRQAGQRATGPRRTWHDVARETRAVYAEAAAGEVTAGGRPA